MRVMVTGSTGFAGFHTVMALLRSGHEVCLSVRNPEKMRAVFEPHGVGELDYVKGDITDEAAVDQALEGCDGVVHAAAMVNLDVRKAELVRHTNVQGTKLVVGGAVERGIKSIVHVSSVTALHSRGLDRITENSPLGGASTGYSKSKVESEIYVRELQEQGAPIAITYPATIVGPDDPGLTGGNLGIATYLGKAILKTSSGMQFIDVRDLADVHVKLLEARRAGRYVVGGHYRSWTALADELENLTGMRVRRVPVPARLLHTLGSVTEIISPILRLQIPFSREAASFGTHWVIADSSKLCQELGLEFRDLSETLKDTILWLNKAGHLQDRYLAHLSAE